MPEMFDQAFNKKPLFQESKLHQNLIYSRIASSGTPNALVPAGC